MLASLASINSNFGLFFLLLCVTVQSFLLIVFLSSLFIRFYSNSLCDETEHFELMSVQSELLCVCLNKDDI